VEVASSINCSPISINLNVARDDKISRSFEKEGILPALIFIAYLLNLLH